MDVVEIECPGCGAVQEAPRAGARDYLQRCSLCWGTFCVAHVARAGGAFETTTADFQEAEKRSKSTGPLDGMTTSESSVGVDGPYRNGESRAEAFRYESSVTTKVKGVAVFFALFLNALTWFAFVMLLQQGVSITFFFVVGVFILLGVFSILHAAGLVFGKRVLQIQHGLLSLRQLPKRWAFRPSQVACEDIRRVDVVMWGGESPLPRVQLTLRDGERVLLRLHSPNSREEVHRLRDEIERFLWGEGGSR